MYNVSCRHLIDWRLGLTHVSLSTRVSTRAGSKKISENYRDILKWIRYPISLSDNFKKGCFILRDALILILQGTDCKRINTHTHKFIRNEHWSILSLYNGTLFKIFASFNAYEYIDVGSAHKKNLPRIVGEDTDTFKTKSRSGEWIIIHEYHV